MWHHNYTLLLHFYYIIKIIFAQHVVKQAISFVIFVRQQFGSGKQMTMLFINTLTIFSAFFCILALTLWKHYVIVKQHWFWMFTERIFTWRAYDVTQMFSAYASVAYFDIDDRLMWRCTNFAHCNTTSCAQVWLFYFPLYIMSPKYIHTFSLNNLVKSEQVLIVIGIHNIE